MPRANVYVDGFNLYFGALRNTPHRWLDLEQLSHGLLRADYQLNRIRYFTARVKNRDGDPTVSDRQQAYLRAIDTLPSVTIHYGLFLTHSTSMPRADGSGFAQVLKTEEKGSDVNLATWLVLDAVDDDFDTALVISNDTDLIEPIQEVRRRFPVTVGVAAPVARPGRHPNRDLVNASDFNVHITKKRQKLLRDSQFTSPLTDADGREIRKPATW